MGYDDRRVTTSGENPLLTRRRVADPESRFAISTRPRNPLLRLRGLEEDVRNLRDDRFRRRDPDPTPIYRPQKPIRRDPPKVTVDISLDGDYYSNPAPKVPNGAHVWVRATIDEAHKGQVGIPETHEMCHVSWTVPAGWHALDGYPSAGRDEYYVCLPLMLVREFTAPRSGATNGGFACDVQPYDRVVEP